VIANLADRMDVHLGLPDAKAVRRELSGLGSWRGSRVSAPVVLPRAVDVPAQGQALLASWHLLLDEGRLQDGEPYLAGTARPAEALVSESTAAELGVANGDKLVVGENVTLPVRVADLPDRVVWVPANSGGCSVTRDLRAVPGDIVTIGSAS
jgi:NADH-quinone oxidoreductase subunit G